MGKSKRKNVPDLQDLLERPICYYCDKDFEDTNYLIDHQKAKHFKCPRCNRRLNTAGGLGVHMSQVHKEKLEKVDNALEGREDPGLEIFGMIGYPEDMLNAHKQRVTNEYFRREAEHRARTGNPPAGSKSGHSAEENSKKNESIADMKKRLEEFKKKKAAEKAAAANGSGSEGNTPGVQTGGADTDAHSTQQARAPEIDTITQTTESTYTTFHDGQASTATTGPTTTTYAYRDGTVTTTQNFGNGRAFAEQGNEFANYPPSSAPNFTPYQNMPYPPPGTSPNPPNSMYSTAGGSHFPPRAPPPPMPPMPPKPPSFSPGWPAGPTRTDSQYLPTSGPPSGIGLSASPPPPGSANRQNSLPNAPSLPQRPAFASPSISREDMARMHIGQPPQSTGPPQMGYYSTAQMPPGGYGAPGPHGANAPYGTPPTPYGAPSPQYGAANAPFPPHGGPPVPPWAMSPPPNGFPLQQSSALPPRPTSSSIGDEVDQLIQSVTGQGPPQPRPQEHAWIPNANQMREAEGENDTAHSRKRPYFGHYRFTTFHK